MMKKVYSKVGSDQQQVGGVCPEGWIEMESLRPEGFYLADEVGVWVDGMTDEQAKLNGVLFDGVMCSATAEDQHGLKDIEEYVLAGNDVNFHFENGNSLVLTSANWASFYAVWVQFRQSFFPLP